MISFASKPLVLVYVPYMVREEECPHGCVPHVPCEEEQEDFVAFSCSHTSAILITFVYSFLTSRCLHSCLLIHVFILSISYCIIIEPHGYTFCLYFLYPSYASVPLLVSLYLDSHSFSCLAFSSLPYSYITSHAHSCCSLILFLGLLHLHPHGIEEECRCLVAVTLPCDLCIAHDVPFISPT
jgi:hypothetical protein